MRAADAAADSMRTAAESARAYISGGAPQSGRSQLQLDVGGGGGGGGPGSDLACSSPGGVQERLPFAPRVSFSFELPLPPRALEPFLVFLRRGGAPVRVTLEPWPGLWESDLELVLYPDTTPPFEGVAELKLTQNVEEESVCATLADPAPGGRGQIATATELYGVARERADREARAKAERETLQRRVRDEAAGAAAAATFQGRRELLRNAISQLEAEGGKPGPWAYAVELLRETRAQLRQRLLQFSDPASFDLTDEPARKPELVAKARAMRELVGSVSIKMAGEVQGPPKPRVAVARADATAEEAFGALEDLECAVARLLKEVRARGLDLVGLRADAERALHATADFSAAQRDRLREDLVRFRALAPTGVDGLVCQVDV